MTKGRYEKPKEKSGLGGSALIADGQSLGCSARWGATGETFVGTENGKIGDDAILRSSVSEQNRFMTQLRDSSEICLNTSVLQNDENSGSADACVIEF